MRIAVIAPPWAPIPPTLYGGIEQAVDSLARGFAASGHEVLLFCTGDSTSPVPKKWELPEADGLRIGFTVPELRHVMAAYDEISDFDAVHDHTVVGPVYCERYPGLPVITTIHGPFNEELRAVYRRVAERVPIIAVSHSQARGAPDIRIARVIHHGVDASAFPYREKGGDYVLFLGRLAPEKGPQRAIAAAREAGVPLVLAGKCREEWEQKFFAAEIEPHLNDDIRWVGEVEHEEKLKLLAGAKATLFPIRWAEPFGLVIIESLACGTPVIAFPEGAAPEVIDDGRTGALVNSESEMADAIKNIDSISRAQCRAATEGYFSTDRMVREHLELFEELKSR